MDKLGTMKKCPKCNGFNFGITFIDAEKYRNINGSFDILEDEYMEVKCLNCGYIKKELPLYSYKIKE